MFPTASSDPSFIKLQYINGQRDRIVTLHHCVVFISPLDYSVWDLARFPAFLSDRRTDLKRHPTQFMISCPI
jgi:hypothetical protein